MNNRFVDPRTAELDGVNENMQLRLEWLSEVIRIRRTILGEVSLPMAYEQLSAVIHQTLGATLVFILNWENQKEQSRAPYYSQQGSFVADAKIISSSFQKDSLLRRTVELGRVVTYTTDQVVSLSASLGEYFQQTNIQLSIFAPLIIRQSVIGVLCVAVTEPLQDFIVRQVDLVKRMAIDVANLTQDAILFEQTLSLAASDERNRLARDLHDSVTQALFSASLLAEVLPRIWRRDPDQGLQKLENLRQLTRGALAEMRTLLIELRPSSLINTPLSDLLAQLAEAVMSRSNLSFQLLIERTPVLPEKVQINFYRIAQEALNNVVKHADAEEVTLSLSSTSLIPDSTGTPMREINLTIRDNGIGYSLVDGQSTTHLGVGIMRERAEAIQASLSVESQPGRGTQITLIWRGENKEV